MADTIDFPGGMNYEPTPAYDDKIMLRKASGGDPVYTNVEDFVSAAGNNVIGSTTPSGSPSGSEVAGQSYRVSNTSGAEVTYTNFLDKNGDPVTQPDKTSGYLVKNSDGWVFSETPVDVNTDTFASKSDLAPIEAAGTTTGGQELLTNLQTGFWAVTGTEDTTNSNWKHQMIDVQPGEIYELLSYVSGATASPVYGFDGAGAKVNQVVAPPVDNQINPLEVTIPSGVSKIGVSSQVGYPFSLKKIKNFVVNKQNVEGLIGLENKVAGYDSAVQKIYTDRELKGNGVRNGYFNTTGGYVQNVNWISVAWVKNRKSEGARYLYKGTVSGSTAAAVTAYDAVNDPADTPTVIQSIDSQSEYTDITDQIPESAAYLCFTAVATSGNVSSFIERVYVGMDEILEYRPLPSFGFPYRLMLEYGVLKTDYDFYSLKNSISGKKYYVDPVNGLDTNEGTEADPFKSIAHALGFEDMNVMVLPESGFFDYNNGWKGAVQKNDLKVIGNGSILSTHVDIAFTPHATLANVFQGSYSIGTVTNIVDLTNLDENGEPILLSRAASADAVSTAPNSMFVDTVNKIVYVHLFDGRIPDANILNLLNSLNGYSNNDFALYMENTKFYGGIAFKSVSTNKRLETNNCRFNYTFNTGSAGFKDGFYHNGGGIIRHYNSGCHYNQADGFNYDGTSQIFEWQCNGYYNGLYSDNDSNNGSTCHTACRIIRALCDYQKSKGKTVQDIGNTWSYNLFVTGGNSLAAGSNDKAAFAIGSETSNENDDPRMWLIGCTAAGGDTYALKVFAPAIAYIDGGNILASPNWIPVGATTQSIEKKAVIAI